MGEIQLKRQVTKEEKDIFEILFDELEEKRNFMEYSFLESLRRHKKNYLKLPKVVKEDINLSKDEKTEIIRGLSIFSPLKNMR